MIDAIFLGTIIPLIFLIIVLKGENRLIMAFFSWGLIAFLISLFINNIIVKQLNITTGQLSVTWAPVVEELFKAVPMLYFLSRKKNTDYSIIYFAMASGIGFSIQENYLYLVNNTFISGSPVIYIIVRSITTCLMHGICTAIIGYGLQILRRIKVMTLPLLFGLFALAVTLHALFNLYINSSLKLLGMVLPILLYLIGILILMSEDEDRRNTGTV